MQCKISCCVSCNELLNAGDTVVRFERYKVPETDVEIAIYGDSIEACIPLACWYLCEKCGEIYFNLVDIGYECIHPCMVLDAQQEYWKNTGFDPKKYQEFV